MLSRRGLSRLIFGAAALATTGLGKVAEALTVKKYDRVGVRCLMVYIKKTLNQTLEPYLFEPDGLKTRRQIAFQVHEIFTDLVKRGIIKEYTIWYLYGFEEKDPESFSMRVRWRSSHNPPFETAMVINIGRDVAYVNPIVDVRAGGAT